MAVSLFRRNSTGETVTAIQYTSENWEALCNFLDQLVLNVEITLAVTDAQINDWIIVGDDQVRALTPEAFKKAYEPL